ncbi:MAG TPA: alkaline phosphatase D family protein [Flavobacteriales bacterium]|nr:alkaline phosphatase D family protein [Flavobacteriales bacterium]
MRPVLSTLAFCAVTLQAQLTINGPMPGHTDLLEATIWMQCLGPCTAYMEFWSIDRPDSVLRTEELIGDSNKAFAMDHVMQPVVPGTTYGYRPIVNGTRIDVGQALTFTTQPIWKFRNDPPAFSMALGSCAYINEPEYDRPGRPYGNGYGIFNAIADKKPDLMLWLGDNVYLREPDWGSRTGYLHRYTHTRSTPELQRLLRSTSHYAAWDDHDFGPNDGDGSFVNSALAREVFDLFWPNPTNGVPGVGGVTTTFSHLDVDFFLLDDRTFRTRSDLKTSPTAMLGAAQIDWLIKALKYSDAAFKLIAVGGQVLNDGAVFENYSTYPDEQKELLRRIEMEGIKNVVFLTGDRHFSQLSTLVFMDGRKVHDLTVSPFTSGVYSPTEINSLMVDGTLVVEQNFGTLTFTGAKNARTMKIQIFNTKGEQLWEKAIEQEK